MNGPSLQTFFSWSAPVLVGGLIALTGAVSSFALSQQLLLVPLFTLVACCFGFLVQVPFFEEWYWKSLIRPRMWKLACQVGVFQFLGYVLLSISFAKASHFGESLCFFVLPPFISAFVVAQWKGYRQTPLDFGVGLFFVVGLTFFLYQYKASAIAMAVAALGVALLTVSSLWATVQYHSENEQIVRFMSSGVAAILSVAGWAIATPVMGPALHPTNDLLLVVLSGFAFGPSWMFLRGYLLAEARWELPSWANRAMYFVAFQISSMALYILTLGNIDFLFLGSWALAATVGLYFYLRSALFLFHPIPHSVVIPYVCR